MEDMLLKLSDLERQMEMAKLELHKPFEKEQELEAKMARLAQLNVLLSSTEAKTEKTAGSRTGEVETSGTGRRPSVLDKLNRFKPDTSAGSSGGPGISTQRGNGQAFARHG